MGHNRPSLARGKIGVPRRPARLEREVAVKVMPSGTVADEVARPPGLEYIILKSLEKDPHLRYQTSRELGADLECLEGRELIPRQIQTLTAPRSRTPWRKFR